MDDSGNLESKISKEKKPEAQDSKKRKKMDERVVVEVKLEESEGPPPSDSWSWRKYGQKPIKGSPYPRGYYRCSTSKGCSAKKQVERCRTDGSILIITYTSSHNHAGPTLHASTNQNQDLITEQPPSQTQDQEQEQEQEEQEIIMDKQMNTFTEKENLENRYDYEEPVSNSDPMNLSASKSEENDFFDELEELPVSSFLTDFSTLFEERILVNLS